MKKWRITSTYSYSSTLYGSE